MINKIISTDEPIDVDELLVVTFTNASAAEMRHRIGEALEKAKNSGCLGGLMMLHDLS